MALKGLTPLRVLFTCFLGGMATERPRRQHEAAEVRRYGNGWCEHIRLLTRTMAAARALLATQHSVLGGLLPDDPALTEARTAAGNVHTVVVKRMTDFSSAMVPRSGLAWESLKEAFRDACVEVERVRVALIMDIALLFHGDDVAAEQGLEVGVSRLTVELRHTLENSEVVLNDKTNRFIAQAATWFASGRQ